MSDEQTTMIQQFHETFPEVITLEDAMRITLRLKRDRDYWLERCRRAEECVEFLDRRKTWWRR